MTDDQQEETPKHRPEIEFKGSGGIKVAVWRHKHDDGPDGFTAVVTRTYMDKNGEFNTVPYLRDSDLLRTQKVLEQADAWIEQEKSRIRATQSERQR